MTYPEPDESRRAGRGHDLPYGGQPYTGQPYGAVPPHLAGGPAPRNHQAFAITVTVISVLFFNPISLALGVIALIKANNVNPLWAQGRVVESAAASRMARLLSIWSTVLMVVGWVLGGLAFVVFFVALTSLPAY